MYKIISNFLKYRPRLSISLVVAIVIAGVLFNFSSLRTSLICLLALDAALFIFLLSMSHYMSTGTQHKMLNKARQQNTGKWFGLTLSVIISAILLIALYVELHIERTDQMAFLHLFLAGSSVLLAWLFIAFMFALEYAHSFALNGGGLLFPETQDPDYWDFVYFSVTLNMAFQTSDVQITGRHLRRLAMIHSIISFFFNMVIIAITINVLAGAL